MPSPAQPITLILSSLRRLLQVTEKKNNQRCYSWIRKMHITLPLLFLFIGSTSTQRAGTVGDFGKLTACRTNTTLRLECSYANCPSSPNYHCEYTTSDGSLPANATKTCKLDIPDHYVQYRNNITNYTCILTRRGRKEEKQITIDYSIQRGKNYIKDCSGTTGFLQHRAPTLLWPLVILSLWRVVDTDSQTT